MVLVVISAQLFGTTFTSKPHQQTKAMTEESPAANVIDIKLHGISNVPASWAADSGAPPIFNDHVFRYEVDITLAGVSHTFKNGRLLHNIPLYADYIEQAKLASVAQANDDDLGEEAAPTDVPSAVVPPAVERTGEEPMATSRSNHNNSIDGSVAPSSILWVLGTEIDVDTPMEVGTKKEAKGAAAKKGAAAAPLPPQEAVKPVAPNANAPPPCVARFPLQLSHLTTLEEQLDSHVPLTLKFRRVLRSNCPGDWEDTQEAKFQGTVSVSLKALTEPGSRQLDATVQLEPVVSEVPEEDVKGKKKPAAKKTKGTAPAILTEELDANEPHPYTANKTTCTISLSCLSAVTRLPEGRPRPDLQPADMIPKRLKPPRRPVEATKQYTKEVDGLTARIIRDYREHQKAQGADVAPEDLRASFLQMLQTSGKGHVYREILVPPVQGIVKETFIRKTTPTAEEMDRVSNELYTYLVDHLHLTLNRSFAAAADPAAGGAAPGSDGDAVDRWKRLAMEAEVMQEFAIAAKYHQERLVQCRSRQSDDEMADVWSEYAEYCLRVRDTLKAEQGYREALAVDMAHLPSLVGYGALLLSRHRFKEADVFLQSAVDLAGTAVSWGCVALYYDTLLLTLSDAPEEANRRTLCVRESKYAIGQAVRTADGDDASPETVYEMLGKHLLDLHQEELANVCLAKAKPSQAVDLLFAKLFAQTQQYDESVAILTQLLEADAHSADARLLLGDVYAATHKAVEAEQQYDAALRIDAHCGSGPAYVRLGNMYVALGKHKDALSAFLMGAKVWPCGLTWLGVGIAYFRMDDLVRAEQALNESNTLNNLNPKAWAYLALVCLRQRREDEGDQAFNQAIKQGLADSFLVAEIGAEQMRLGRHKIAEACYRRSIALNDDCNTRMHLARALAAMRRLGEARDEFAHVAQHSTSETQQNKALEQLAMIPAE
jgi:tetratricopeptide (TPR) repeat protein